MLHASYYLQIVIFTYTRKAYLCFLLISRTSYNWNNKLLPLYVHLCPITIWSTLQKRGERCYIDIKLISKNIMKELGQEKKNDSIHKNKRNQRLNNIYSGRSHGDSGEGNIACFICDTPTGLIYCCKFYQPVLYLILIM